MRVAFFQRLFLVSAVFFFAGLLASPPVWAVSGGVPKLNGAGDPKKGGVWYRDAGCDGCHGPTGKGDGPSGASLDPRPANYCTSTKHPTDADKIKHITEGGARDTPPSAMPAWGEVLDKQAIVDLVAYIHTLCGK